MVQKFQDVFRIKLSADPPAKVWPLVITHADKARPLGYTIRCHPPQQRDFIV